MEKQIFFFFPKTKLNFPLNNHENLHDRYECKTFTLIAFKYDSGKTEFLMILKMKERKEKMPEILRNQRIGVKCGKSDFK